MFAVREEIGSIQGFLLADEGISAVACGSFSKFGRFVVGGADQVAAIDTEIYR